MNLDPEKWPEVPKSLRPKKLPVNENVAENVKSALSALGWEVTDTRLAADAERYELILLGVSLNSILLTDQLSDYLKLELSLRQKDLKNEKPNDSFTGQQTVDTLMGFAKQHTDVIEIPLEKRKAGRKPKY